MTVLNRKRPAVSDHAVLRWLERRYGFDVEAERMKIDAFTKAARAAGARTIAMDGVKFVIREGHVVTTLDHQMRTKFKPGERVNA